MVASSPVRHEPPPNMQPNPVEVQQYQAPWKALSDFALQSELEQPPFQQLVSTFGDSSDEDTIVTLDEPAHAHQAFPSHPLQHVHPGLGPPPPHVHPGPPPYLATDTKC